jgi:hypothetical protein
MALPTNVGRAFHQSRRISLCNGSYPKKSKKSW